MPATIAESLPKLTLQFLFYFGISAFLNFNIIAIRSMPTIMHKVITIIFVGAYDFLRLGCSIYFFVVFFLLLSRGILPLPALCFQGILPRFHTDLVLPCSFP